MTKEARYLHLIPELSSLLDESDDFIATLANASSAIKHAFKDFSWVGFYLLKKDELILGPFQGLPACVSIRVGRGVCGNSFQQRTTLVVPDVRLFPGHIACDSKSLSEIVVPMIVEGKGLGVLDIDSHKLSTFDETDRHYLEQIVALILEKVSPLED